MKIVASARRNVKPLPEVIEFGDSYKVPTTTNPNNTTTRKDDEKSGRTVTITTEDMQRKKNDAVILKTFGGNEATKKRKKNLLKQQYGNFKAEGSETLEQTFNRLHVIVSQLQFMDVEVKKDDLNQKFLTSLAPEWLMHTIVWRNRNDLDTMNLDDVYNHLKVYEAEVQKKSNPNSQNLALFLPQSTAADMKMVTLLVFPLLALLFPLLVLVLLQSAKTLLVPILLLNPMSMALLSMRANKFWKRTGKKISIQGSDVALTNQKLSALTVTRWVISQESAEHPEVKKEEGKKTIDREDEGEDHALVADAEAPTEFALMANTESKDLETLKLKKDGVDGKLAGLLKASKNFDNLIEITDYSRPSPTVASTSAEGQNKNSTTSKDVASPNTPKPFVKFVKPKDSQSESKTNKQETPKKPQVKYAEQYRHSNKKPNVKGNQRNWNNLKSYQLGPEFVLKKKACFSCGDFSHLANDCRKRVQRETTRKFPTASRKFPTGSTKIHTADIGRKGKAGSSQNNIDDKGYCDSGCSRHMTGNISYLSDFEPFDGGYVSFGQGGCKIISKGTIKTECIVLGRDFKLLDDANILLRIPRLGHLNVKTMNKLVRHNLVRGLPTKSFDNDHTCTACLKGKQHKASYNLGKFEAKGDEEPKKVSDALQDPSWVEAMQEELLQFKT
nr:hypothetical protein [Tanacetum cinerariifolium]